MSEDEPRPNANAAVARLFAEIGDILERKGEQPYRYNAYRTAARSVGGARERLDVLFQEGRLRELHGVIQVAMGWEGIHLYQWHCHGSRMAAASLLW